MYIRKQMMMQKRNCNLDLGLVTPSPSPYPNSHQHHYRHSPDEKQQKLTIFYNGRMTACDATELQARAIILLASSGGDMEAENWRRLSSSPTVTASAGLSMRRSLQRFLQKRKARAQSISPYVAAHSYCNKNN